MTTMSTTTNFNEMTNKDIESTSNSKQKPSSLFSKGKIILFSIISIILCFGLFIVYQKFLVSPSDLDLFKVSFDKLDKMDDILDSYIENYSNEDMRNYVHEKIPSISEKICRKNYYECY